MTTLPTASHEAGFSLVEALIALAIIATMTAAFVGTVGQDARMSAAADQRASAALVARSALDRALAGDPAADGEIAGLHWHVGRHPFGASDPLDRAPLEEVSVAVTLAGSARPLIVLSSVRVRS